MVETWNPNARQPKAGGLQGLNQAGPCVETKAGEKYFYLTSQYAKTRRCIGSWQLRKSLLEHFFGHQANQVRISESRTISPEKSLSKQPLTWRGHAVRVSRWPHFMHHCLQLQKSFASLYNLCLLTLVHAGLL